MLDPKIEKQYGSELFEELQAVLATLWPLEPTLDPGCGEYVLSHPDYPTIAAPGDTPEEAIAAYHRMLARFLSARMKGNLAPHVERMTSGRGGVRAGSGRPVGVGSKPQRIPSDIQDVVDWLRTDPEHVSQVRRLMQA